MPAAGEQSFPGDARTPAAARRFASARLAALLGPRLSPSLCDDVELVVSELVTNAVRAGSPTVEISIVLARGRVVIGVTDYAPGRPEPRDATTRDTGGRGLALVGAVSLSWGVRAAQAGKLVWSEIAIS